MKGLRPLASGAKMEAVAQRRIVYFVGAGLSKALEKPGSRIPLMNDFVQVMAERADTDDAILTTLAEMENAKVFEFDCDDCSALAQKVVGKNADRRAETKRAFKKAFMGRRPESIERLLAKALTKKMAKDGPSATALVIRFNYAINRFFSTVGWNFDSALLEKFLRHQFGLYAPQSSCHTFVSFNYDLILDHTTQATAKDIWNPFTGYGFRIRKWLEPGKNQIQQLQPQLCCPPGEQILILKPHGSLNWLVPQAKSGQTGDMGYLLEDGPVCVPLTPKDEIRYSDFIEPTAIHPYILAVCILPPTEPGKRTKLAFIEKTWCLERLAVEQADEAYILGWSMPATDQDQICLIRGCVAERKKPLDSVTVVNRGGRCEYFKRIADTFGVVASDLRIFNDGFADYVRQAAGL